MPSRLQAYLDTMDKKTAESRLKSINTTELAQEIAEISRELPEPKLFKEAKSRKSYSYLSFSLIAAIFAAILGTNLNFFDDKSQLRIKGSNQITLYYEHNGLTSNWKKVPLKSGDRIMAEILSSDEAKAFWWMGASDNRIFSDLKSILNYGLNLQPGKLKRFGHSYELEGKNEGEILFVALCPASQIIEKASLEAFMSQMQRVCQIHRYPLR